MTIPMQPLELTTHRLDPTEADVRLAGDFASARLMGPRCAYATTVEVAYYFKPVSEGGLRAIVPEPSYWDPQSPFLYEALVTNKNGSKASQKHGLRQLRLTAGGLRLNRRPFRVEGTTRSELTDAASLRAAGIDTIICPVTDATRTLWQEADVLGFFLIGEIDDAVSLDLARTLKRHVSALGWIVRPDLIDPIELQTQPGVEPLLGLLADSPPIEMPPWVQFLLGPPTLTGCGVPWLCQGESAPADAFGSIGDRSFLCPSGAEA